MKHTVPIRYIGKKPSEVCPFGSGVEWMNGEIQPVPIEFVPQLLAHETCFEDARSATAQKKQPIGPYVPKVPRRDIDKELPVVNLMYMNKDALRSYANREFRSELPEHFTEQQMRDTLRVRIMTEAEFR